jgi:type IV pilus assembly protein PilY1
MCAVLYRLTAYLLPVLMGLSIPLAHAEDIDIFIGGAGSAAGKPNVIILLDNTSNWARQSQKWPGGLQQGQAEVRAIKNVLKGLTGKINLGVLEFVSQGNANDNGAYVRMAVKELTAANQAILEAKLDAIYAGINTPIEKRNANEEYGNLISDVYNYLGGFQQVQSGNGTPGTLADSDGYTHTYTRFKSPLTLEGLCANTYLIFITNPNSSGPANDDAANSTRLRDLLKEVSDVPSRLAGDNTGTSLPLSQFSMSTQKGPLLATSTACYKTGAEALASSQFSEECTTIRKGNTVESSCIAAQGTYCSGSGKNALYKWNVFVNETVVVPTGTYDTVSGTSWNLDDWARFLYVHGVPVPGGDAKNDRAKVTTYTLDVFNAQQNADHTALMLSTARQGGGKYFAARNQEAIEKALEEILSEILSVNSTFASVSLPISHDTRTQNENQVFVGMFRPDPKALPRWAGNLKRYQLGVFDGGTADLVDAQGGRVLNALSGFITDCAVSFWTTHSTPLDYWKNLQVNPDPVSKCFGTPNPYSDLPDGPQAEKGGVAQRLRMSTIPDREVKMAGMGSSTLSDFKSGTEATASLDEAVVRFIRGEDTEDRNQNTNLTEARPDIHGDVVHSRPMAINYGGDTGVVVFYGSNDGLLRGIRANTGKELWSFVAEPHLPKLQRLFDNKPILNFTDGQGNEDRRRKEYFFDGPIGALVDYDESHKISKAYIFASMRRGGRGVYAFDVTSPATPSLLWSKGCASETEACSGDFGLIGQTWSTPLAAYVKGYEGGKEPIVIMGGGYDGGYTATDTPLCEDVDSPSRTGCRGWGSAVYVLDAKTGALLRRFEGISGSVPGDVSLVDMNYDGFVDMAYAVDTDGNLYRMTFTDPKDDWEPLSKDSWSIRKIAKITSSSVGRKFMYGPAVMAYRGKVFLAMGTGNRERPLPTDYPFKTGIQDRFYVFRDDPDDDKEYALDSSTDTKDLSGENSCEAQSLTYNSANPKGWFIKLPNKGEQTVSSALIVGGMVTFNTSQAQSSESVRACGQPEGTARGYWLNLLNASGGIGTDGICGGRRSTEFVGTAMPPSPVMATVMVNGRLETVIISSVPLDGSASRGALDVVRFQPKVEQTRSRIYWSSDVDR